MNQEQIIKKNEKIEVSIKNLPNCIVEFTVKVFKDFLGTIYSKAIKEVIHQVEVPGFRKGKAPKELVVSQYKSNIEERVKFNLLNEAFVEAQKLTSIFPINPNKVIFNVNKYVENEEGIATYIFETQPVVPSIDINKFKLNDSLKKKREVSEKEIDEAIRETLFFYAKWEDSKDAVKMNDFIIVDIFDVEVNPEEKMLAGVRFEVTEKRAPEWLLKAVVGKEKKSFIECESYPNEDSSDEEKQFFQKKKVKVNIIEIQKVILPELNQELFDKLGIKSESDFRGAVVEKLHSVVDMDFSNKQTDSINKFLLTEGQFSIPLSIIQDEEQYRLKALHQNKNWKKLSDKEKANVEANLKVDARNAVSLFYISEKVARDNKVTISEEEVVNEINSLYDKNISDLKNVKQELYGTAYSKLLLKKVNELVLNNYEKNIKEDGKDSTKNIKQ